MDKVKYTDEDIKNLKKIKKLSLSEDINFNFDAEPSEESLITAINSISSDSKHANILIGQLSDDVRIVFYILQGYIASNADFPSVPNKKDILDRLMDKSEEGLRKSN
jgi:hypothetical protein